MHTAIASMSRAGRILAVSALALGVSFSSNAQTYDFNTFLSGGGGGPDPNKQRIARGAGAYICVAVAPTGKDVLFTLWYLNPERRSYIRNIAFDTGRHSDLFTKVSILIQPPGSKAIIGQAKGHAFLPRITPDYWIDIPHPGGLMAGQSITIAATLGAGKTFAHVMNALTEGTSPTTAATGLRVAVVANALLGGPPPGVATIMDDGGFVITRPSARCQSR